MSNSYYENGATHNDHHKELHIDSVNGSDVGKLISAFFNNEAEEWQVHEEIERLVARQGIQEICKYLKGLSDAQRVLLPQNAEKAYNELVRLGMPNGEGYSLKTFMKYYKR